MTSVPRVVVAGASSGVGKTAVSCAIIYGLEERGFSVQPFKVGPDYIDPSHLGAVSKSPARNLDSWLMTDADLYANFAESSTKDVSVIEGVMGYYDGISGRSSAASTFDVASKIKAPVILVLDASRTARSIAATALGFAKFHKNSRIAGVILNRIGSKRHERFCRDAMAPLKIPIAGVIPRDDSLAMPSRHLGLVPAAEGGTGSIVSAAKKMAEHLDFDKIISICKTAAPLRIKARKKPARARAAIAVALDASFNFYYQENLDELRRSGARISFFSPMSDEKIPRCGGIYIGGGFPEVQGELLAKNQSMIRSIKKAAESGMPVYAECGGLMYLTRAIRYKKKHKMVGLFDADTVMTGKRTLGYVGAEAVRDSIVSKARAGIRAHEFHYSMLESVPSDAKFAYRIKTGQGIGQKRDGLMQHGTLASYCHLMLGERAARITDACVKFSRR